MVGLGRKPTTLFTGEVMTHHENYYNQPHPAVEVLLKNGFDGLAELLKLLFDEVKSNGDIHN